MWDYLKLPWDLITTELKELFRGGFITPVPLCTIIYFEFEFSAPVRVVGARHWPDCQGEDTAGFSLNVQVAILVPAFGHDPDLRTKGESKNEDLKVESSLTVTAARCSPTPSRTSYYPHWWTRPWGTWTPSLGERTHSQLRVDNPLVSCIEPWPPT